MYVVGFNGPPKSGKDSIAQAVRTMIDLEFDIPTFTDSIIRPMREAVMSLAGHDPRDYTLYNQIKDKPAAAFNGDTIRHVMIQMSENFMRKKYGKSCYVRTLIHANKVTVENPGIIFVPDIGFEEEIKEFTLTVGEIRFINFHVHRPDHGWGHDSRRYCSGEAEPIILHNDSTVMAAAEVVLDWIKTYGWLI